MRRTIPLLLTAQEPLGPPLPRSVMDRKRAILTFLQHVHTYPTAIQSDLARTDAHLVAEAASRGYITTQVVPGAYEYGRYWKITGNGLLFLNMGASLIKDQELAAYNAHL